MCHPHVTQSVHLQVPQQHNTTTSVCAWVCVCVCFRMSACFLERGDRKRLWSVCVFPDVSKRVDCSDGCWGAGGLERSERVHCVCVIDASWLMAGLNTESFLLKVTGERPNRGHLWLSATFSFVIAHLSTPVEVHGSVCPCVRYLCVVWPLWGIG